ncbi:saccharopine dehydrogenase NADP-binding domain-containing protein [Scatolibacter rhodanostii]|uniref:saccharopine dehydrogenase NADP-binding domain-containing protein n=1 Tax=Scatolibacter rhodanostii TaxID=2014781 RepID=UPI000C07BEA6|nr:saccharopine dehydrogenase NADP-binding domain-containing protein [Scatolibacter rhodanostii]
MNTTGKIIIIGGHGKVGQYITRELKQYNLILVGRSRDKIKNFLDNEKIQAEICIMDIDNLDFTKLNGVRWVIVCVDQENTKLVEFCDSHDIDYMDVTANSEYIEKIQQLKLRGKSKILLGIGLAPGLTNLLAEKFVKLYPSAEKISIEIILGLGEKHGDAAIQWTLDNFLKSYSHLALGLVRPFTQKSSIDTEQAGEKNLKTYNFNFVDQHMLNLKYTDKIFTTYLGFDQPFATGLIYGANKLKLLGLLKYKPFYRMAQSALKSPKFGTDIFMVAVKSGNKILYARGHDEGRFTGLMAAKAARQMETLNLQNGLLDISDVIDIEEVKNNESFGLTLSL